MSLLNHYSSSKTNWVTILASLKLISGHDLDLLKLGYHVELEVNSVSIYPHHILTVRNMYEFIPYKE